MLKVYRDCGSSVLVSTTGQVLNVVGGTQNFNAALTHVSTKDITPVCSSAVSKCVSPAGTVGFQEYTFVFICVFRNTCQAPSVSGGLAGHWQPEIQLLPPVRQIRIFLLSLHLIAV